MADIKRINDIISSKGLKKSFIAEQIGVSINGITRKLDGRSEFKAGEIVELCRVLGITDPREKVDIFLR